MIKDGEEEGTEVEFKLDTENIDNIKIKIKHGKDKTQSLEVTIVDVEEFIDDLTRFVTLLGVEDE
jgi:hypothetical protein